MLKVVYLVCHATYHSYRLFIHEKLGLATHTIPSCGVAHNSVVLVFRGGGGGAGGGGNRRNVHGHRPQDHRGGWGVLLTLSFLALAM